MSKYTFYTILLVLLSSCGHMVGPLFYERNSCGPYKNEEVETSEFKTRSKDIRFFGLNDEPENTCSVVQEFHCWDYLDYALQEYDLKAVAIKAGGNTLKVARKWTESDGFGKGLQYNHFSGRVLNCKE